jgi:cytochrome c-type biogenesis protein CcmF
VRRRVGGYLVHAGIALCFVAFAGRAFDAQTHVTVKTPGESFRAGAHTLRYDGLVEGRDAEKETVTALVSVGADRLAPARWIYSGGQPTSEVGIRRGLLADLYVTLDAVDESGRVSLTVRTNPLVSFLWLGFLVVLAGTVVALLPGRRGVRA